MRKKRSPDPARVIAANKAYKLRERKKKGKRLTDEESRWLTRYQREVSPRQGGAGKARRKADELPPIPPPVNSETKLVEKDYPLHFRAELPPARGIEERLPIEHFAAAGPIPVEEEGDEGDAAADEASGAAAAEAASSPGQETPPPAAEEEEAPPITVKLEPIPTDEEPEENIPNFLDDFDGADLADLGSELCAVVRAAGYWAPSQKILDKYHRPMCIRAAKRIASWTKEQMGDSVEEVSETVDTVGALAPIAYGLFRYKAAKEKLQNQTTAPPAPASSPAPKAAAQVDEHLRQGNAAAATAAAAAAAQKDAQEGEGERRPPPPRTGMGSLG